MPWTSKLLVGGGNSIFLECSPHKFWEDSYFDEHIFSDGLVQPPTSKVWVPWTVQKGRPNIKQRSDEFSTVLFFRVSRGFFIKGGFPKQLDVLFGLVWFGLFVCLLVCFLVFCLCARLCVCLCLCLFVCFDLLHISPCFFESASCFRTMCAIRLYYEGHRHPSPKGPYSKSLERMSNL